MDKVDAYTNGLNDGIEVLMAYCHSEYTETMR